VAGYEKIDLRPETRFIATMNYGYAGTRDLNEALTSRFAVLDMPVISEENLQKLISRRYPAISVKIRDQLVKLYGELERKAESAEISDSALDLRGLLDAIALMEQGLRSGDALDMCIVNKSFDAYERGLIRDVISARIPADLTRGDVFVK
jgi:MoxR-like ATPase